MDLFHLKEKRKGSMDKPFRSPKLHASKQASLNITIESPPLVLFGTPAQSSGALFSGQLMLAVTDPAVTLQSFTMVLNAKVTLKRPVHKDCSDCSTQINELKSWKFITEATTYSKEIHSFPFSHLLPGHLPATTHGLLGNIEYILTATATTSLDTITATHVLDLKRALQPPSHPRISTRIFPPTRLKAEVSHPPVIHQIGEFNVIMRMTGVIFTDTALIRRWRLRKMAWRIDEFSKIISPACHKHAQKLGGDGKGILHNDTRTIGSKDLKDGWKNDFSAPDGGLIEIEFPISVKPNQSPICDVENPTGLEVTHRLILELIVAEEVAGHKTSKSFGATGTARVLRMQFAVVLTERGGLGISWDEEMPPLYEDVPASPPGYKTVDTHISEPMDINDFNLHD